MPAAKSSKSLQGRLSAKVGPLPVWAWVLVLLLGGYLVYRLRAGGAAQASSAASGTDTSGTPLAGASTQPALDNSGGVGSGGGSGGGTPADTSQLSAELGTALTGVSSQLDTLTQAVQASQAFAGAGGTGGYGSTGYYPGPDYYPGPLPPGPVQTAPRRVQPRTPARHALPQRHAAPPARPQPTHYYTFKPGHASSGKRQAAPAAHGRTLHYKQGKGYYYA